MTQEKTHREINQTILNEYDGSEIMHPQVILRNVHQLDSNVLDDDIKRVEVDPYERSDEELGEFSWAIYSLLAFQKQYRKMLEDPTERIHLEALARNGCRIFIENQCSSSRGNGKDRGYIGISTVINNKPAIALVANAFDNSTLLHEAIHNSDIKLDPNLHWLDKQFSSLDIHHAAVMMLDAQKITAARGYQTVKACRNINKLYQDGEMYVEGLAWITQLPMETLAKEKNHIGKHLKVLHGIYTEAILKQQSAILDCFQYWKPSEHIAEMLKEYDKNKQKIGKNRDKILKQQKHFWDELLRFRKEINKLKVHNLASQTLSYDLLYFCKLHEVKSLASAYLAQHKADELYKQAGQNKVAHAENLKSLFAEIKPNDLNHASLFAEKFLACYAYFKKINREQMSQNFAESLFELPFATKGKSTISIRKKLYDNMKARVNIIEKQAKSGSPNRHSTLAYLYGTSTDSVIVGDAYVKLKMDSAATTEQKREFAQQTIGQAREFDAEFVQNGRFKAEAVIVMSELLGEYGLQENTHGLLQADNLKNLNTSEKVVRDLHWLKTDDKDDGLPSDIYHCFEAGIIDEYCRRPASTFEPESPDFIPNNYRHKGKNKTAYVRALYELLAARHRYQAATHCKTFPKDLSLNALRPNSDYYKHINAPLSSVQLEAKFADKKNNIK